MTKPQPYCWVCKVEPVDSEGDECKYCERDRCAPEWDED